ncbi:MAG: hypothetical protein JW772_04080 [Candidatus Diapherotrites archaeon]|nr:hypothetical protein [Candidatus Diapherotrites archaeon]
MNERASYLRGEELMAAKKRVKHAARVVAGFLGPSKRKTRKILDKLDRARDLEIMRIAMVKAVHESTKGTKERTVNPEEITRHPELKKTIAREYDRLPDRATRKEAIARFRSALTREERQEIEQSSEKKRDSIIFKVALKYALLGANMRGAERKAALKLFFGFEKQLGTKKKHNAPLESFTRGFMQELCNEFGSKRGELLYSLFLTKFNKVQIAYGRKQMRDDVNAIVRYAR